MSTITTPKRIDLSGLATALGGIALSMTDDGTTRTITGEVDQATLQAAVDAQAEPPDLATLAANQQVIDDALVQAITDLRATVVAMQTITDKANNQITAADTKAIAREVRSTARTTLRLCRAVLGRYDGTE